MSHASPSPVRALKPFTARQSDVLASVRRKLSSSDPKERAEAAAALIEAGMFRCRKCFTWMNALNFELSTDVEEAGGVCVVCERKAVQFTAQTPLDRIAFELRQIEAAKMGFRNSQLGISAKVVVDFIRDGVVDREVARDDLIRAARKTGLGDAEIARTIRWAWGEGDPAPSSVHQAHPLADTAPDVVVDLARNFNLPDDEDDDTGEYSPAGSISIQYAPGVADFALTIEGLVSAIDEVDPTAFERPTVDPWKTPDAFMRRFADLYDFFDLAAGRMAKSFANGDRDGVGDAAAEVVVQAIMTADRFGVPIGKHVARYVDRIAAEAVLSVAVADQAAS